MCQLILIFFGILSNILHFSVLSIILMFNEDERKGSAVTFELMDKNRTADPFIFNNVYYRMKELVTNRLEVLELKWFLNDFHLKYCTCLTNR